MTAQFVIVQQMPQETCPAKNLVELKNKFVITVKGNEIISL